MLTTRTRAAKIAWSLAIVVAAASAGILVDWQAPGIGRYTRDWLMRARGPLPVPEDIAIVAIDEPSMARFGRFPWSRQVIARTIDALAAAHPKVIALDVLFTDPTTQEDDDNLARSIGHAGNVVVAAQLTDSPVHGGPSRWLQPLPAIERAAAAVGHVNAQTELDGTVRQVAIRLADDNGRSYRAMPVEAVRIADGTPEEGITDEQNALLVGARTIRLDTAPPAIAIIPSASTRVLHGGRVTIDYIGPAGSFGPVTYSLSDVVAGRVPAEKLRGKFVLIGATAASLGDRVASPFVRYTDARADQHGALMPGVEVLANAIHVILSSRYYTESSDLAAFLWGATIVAVDPVARMGAGRREFLKQLGVLVEWRRWWVLASLPGVSRSCCSILPWWRVSWPSVARACSVSCGDPWRPLRAWTPTSPNSLTPATCWRPPAPACPVPTIGPRAVRSRSPAAGFPRVSSGKPALSASSTPACSSAPSLLTFALRRSVEDGF